MLITFFIYGLAFFFLGIATFLQAKEESELRFRNTLWALGGFGIVHGLAEWLDMFNFLGDSYWPPQPLLFFRIVTPAIKTASFLLLQWFGFSVLAQLHPRLAKLRFVPALSLISLAILFFAFQNAAATQSQWFLYFNPFIRLLAGFPAAFATGIALIQLRKAPDIECFGSSRTEKGFLGLGISFLIYSILAGIITEKSPLFPSSMINTDSFERFALFPVQAFRTACAVFSAYFMTWILKTFEIESVNSLMHQKSLAENQTIELRKTQQQLVQSAKLASLGELSAGVAHEINQPLFMIQGFANRIQAAFEDNESVRHDQVADYIQEINESVSRITKIVHHIRDFSRQSDRKPEPVMINQILEKSFTLLNEQLKLRKIAIKLELSSENPMVMGDKNRLQQVFINFLTNSRDAIENSPRKESGVISVRSKIDGENIVIDFRDNGAGIDQAIINRIFDPFFTTKEVGKGTGLGLSISHGIIQEHEGKITCISEPGEGALFRIVLPALIHPGPPNSSA